MPDGKRLKEGAADHFEPENKMLKGGKSIGCLLVLEYKYLKADLHWWLLGKGGWARAVKLSAPPQFIC